MTTSLQGACNVSSLLLTQNAIREIMVCLRKQRKRTSLTNNLRKGIRQNPPSPKRTLYK